MHKSTFSKTGNFDEEVIFCLERQMIPAWDHYGMDHLVTSEMTLQEFCKQPLPEQIRACKKKRLSNKPVRNKLASKSNRVIEAWPDEDMHSLRMSSLVYVRAGQADIRLADYMVQCPQEHFLLYRAGVPRPAGKTPFLEEPRQGKQCEIWWFHPTGHNDFISLSVCYSVEDQQTNSGQYYIVSDPHVSQLFHIFVEEMTNRPTDYRKTSAALLGTFLRLFLREIKADRFHNRGVDNLPRSAAAADSPIEMARQYIDKNLNHPLTIDIVAQAVFMAKTNFPRQFREETGQTFRAYLMERRLEEAKHWLTREACSIDVVCKFVGLKNSRFHQLFQQRFGMTPMEFRKSHKNV
jgi:AraC-like DNA-binding protein